MPKLDDLETTVEEIHLHAQQYFYQYSLPEDIIFGNPATIDLIKKTHTDSLIRLRQDVLADKSPDAIRRRWPATWWDHFKKRWFPKWAKKIWPVQYEYLTVTRWAEYPEIPKPVGGYYHCVPKMFVDQYIDEG